MLAEVPMWRRSASGIQRPGSRGHDSSYALNCACAGVRLPGRGASRERLPAIVPAAAESGLEVFISAPECFDFMASISASLPPVNQTVAFDLPVLSAIVQWQRTLSLTSAK